MSWYIVDKDGPCQFMPAKNRVKQYVEDGYYHLYNRGVEKRRIFLDDQDYRVFLHLLRFYLSPIERPNEHPLTGLTGFQPVRKRPITNLHGEVKLLCYCLMPNHFHLLLKQTSKNGMEKLARKLLTTYVLYFNRRYDRIGPLFQGVYKAAIVQTDEHLIHVTRYIHQNPTLTKGFLSEYPYSSYANYLGEKKNEWLDTAPVLSLFKDPKKGEMGLGEFRNYKDFVELHETDPEEIIGNIAMESD